MNLDTATETFTHAIRLSPSLIRESRSNPAIVDTLTAQFRAKLELGLAEWVAA